MQQPRKWWIGLPVLTGLVFFAVQSLTPQIEADLRARTASALGQDPAKVSVAGRDVTIAGLAQDAVRGALRDAPGLRRIAFSDGATPTPPAVVAPPPPAARAPYVFSASLREHMLALEGRLPDEALRKRAVEAAAMAAGGVAVSETLKIEGGAPAGDYAAAVSVALDALKSLSLGRVVLSDGRLAVEGKGRANVRPDQLAADIRTRLPSGFELGSVEVALGPVSPYVFEAVRKGGALTLSGFVPDAATRTRFVDGARRRFFDANIEEHLEVAEGAPEKFAIATEAALAALSRLGDGKLSISDDRFTLAGAVRHDGARAGVEAALADRLPTGVKSELRLTGAPAQPQLDAAGCRAALADLSKTPVVFDATDALTEETAGLVDALTATLLRCRSVAVEVAGYMDDQGVVELNRDRSKRRAQNLVDHFVKAGADPFYVWAMGYGAERPVAPNDSDENRARNRRVEFTVKQAQKEGVQ
jgi:OOP family OmpA-OmpF porin